MQFKGQYYYGTGSRKTAIARVRLYSGKGLVVINGKKVVKADETAISPLVLCGKKDKFDVSVVVRGGGIISQKEAIRHGISRALLEFDQELRPTLKKAGFLTRDPREKERKKPGLKRARRAPQWQKR
ncbi:30S ribosomal protein S9 [Candidatus Berkelbacteria bacterium RIFCSPHIGHO2_12_FULL_36_9]|uniref:Small ribosomal subunit protein uS9 n=1 Tax=Candidatus Berkelbacteria bacterium RIFCSPHIGHO2_12_FULL_36_9 TaxID=1797469 RepID=A0A1F5EKQ9_9BACT|nr:MAG: 30S ribosomal protein S9 [Candidatus Berkelbacteria bacterium RIFCSPHIGHO2_12_FULL_36_9]